MSDNQRKEAFIEALYREHYADLKRYSYHYVHNDSKFTPLIEDCIQETFLKATAHYKKLLVHPNVIGWLVETCRNELNACMRRHLRFRRHFDGLNKVDVESAAADLDDLERWARQHDTEEDIRRIYQALTPLEQSVFEDYYVNDSTMKETAKRNGMTENAVHCTAKRIRQKAERLFKRNMIFFILIQTSFCFSRIV